MFRHRFTVNESCTDDQLEVERVTMTSLIVSVSRVVTVLTALPKLCVTS